MKYPKKVILTIYKKDLTEAEYTEQTDCPIARAVNRKFKPTVVKVIPRLIYINGYEAKYSITDRDNVRVQQMSSGLIKTSTYYKEPKRHKITITRVD